MRMEPSTTGQSLVVERLAGEDGFPYVDNGSGLGLEPFASEAINIAYRHRIG
jgi:hypothetical protein